MARDVSAQLHQVNVEGDTFVGSGDLYLNLQLPLASWDELSIPSS